MPHTTVAYHRTSGGSATEDLTALTPLADPTHSISGTNLYVGEYNRVCMVAAIGAQVNDAQLRSPSLGGVADIDIAPVNQATEPASPPIAQTYFNSPLSLVQGESLQALSDDNASGAADSLVVVSLCSQATTPLNVESTTVKFTSSTTCVADVWNLCALTTTQALPAGRFSCIGARVVSATGIAFRVLPVGSSQRPGGLCCDAVSDLDIVGQRLGGWGEWFQFGHQTIPSIEILTVSTDSAQTVFLDLVKIG